MGILTGLVPQTEHVKVKERIPEMEPPRLGLELQWFDDFPGPPFFLGVPWLPTSLARSSRLIGSVGKGGSCAGLLCGSLATRLRIPPVVPVWLQGWSSCSVQSTGALVRFPHCSTAVGMPPGPSFCWSPSPHFKYHSALWKRHVGTTFRQTWMTATCPLLGVWRWNISSCKSLWRW